MRFGAPLADEIKSQLLGSPFGLITHTVPCTAAPEHSSPGTQQPRKKTLAGLSAIEKVGQNRLFAAQDQRSPPPHRSDLNANLLRTRVKTGRKDFGTLRDV